LLLASVLLGLRAKRGKVMVSPWLVMGPSLCRDSWRLLLFVLGIRSNSAQMQMAPLSRVQMAPPSRT
jgi:hypothetical protein